MTIRALYSGISGLRAHQNSMDVVGSNIANVNTIGYKADRVTFSDLFSQTIRGSCGGNGTAGSINPLQVGLGVKTASIDTLFSQGSFQTTERLFDLAISGQGYFLISDRTDVASGTQYLTRAGNFNLDANGYLVSPSNGYHVLGRMADADGNLPGASGPQAVRIDPSLVDPAHATRGVTLAGNINSLSTPRAASGLGNLRSLFTSTGTPLNLQIGDVIRIDGVSVDGGPAVGPLDVLTVEESTTLNDVIAAFNTVLETEGIDARVEITTTGHVELIAGTQSITSLEIGLASTSSLREQGADAALKQVFDSDPDSGIFSMSAEAGESVESIDWIRQADATTAIDVYDSQGNARTVSMSFCRVTDSATPNNTVNYQIMVPHLGGYELGESFAEGTSGTLVFNSDGTLETESIGALIFDPDGGFAANGGVDPLSINIDISGLTQYSAPNTALFKSQDGRSMGDLDSLSVDSEGVIRGIFTNGESRTLAQIMLATVVNDDGLNKAGDSLFTATTASGLALLGTPLSGGRGSITSGALELSNVDLAAEFTNMIITQRGFQANSRVVTTGDEMLRDVVQLK